MIFIDAVEVNHGLAPHLVGPDPRVADQLIRLGFSKFSVAATVLKLHESAPFVAIIVNHFSCMRFDNLYGNATSPSERHGRFKGVTLVSDALTRNELPLW